MRNDSGHTRSVWMRDDEASAARAAAAHPPLAADAECDVCVVGAGLAGMSVAYQLAREGRRVIVLDDGPIGGGETSRTTAHLASYQDDGVSAVAKAFGEQGARLAVQSHAAAIDEIERIAGAEQIDCAFRRVDAWLFLASTETEQYLNDELEASRTAGLDVEKHARVEGLAWDTGPALRFGRHAQFDPAKYLEGLARAITAKGGTIHTGTHATEMLEGADGEPCTVKTAAGHTIRAAHIVVCTNTPVNDWVTMHTKQAPYRTYVVGFRVPAGRIPAALYWDTADPYHYVRLQHGASSGDDVLIVGGEDHKTGQADDQAERFRCLEEWTRERFSDVQDVAFRWSGQVMEPTDYLGYVGRNPGNTRIYIATGDSGQGMTHCTIAGMLIRDLVLGRPNPWAELYSPSRLPVENLTIAAEYAKENLNVAAQYRDWLTPGDVASVARIAPGSGAVLRDGAHKVAAYRADDGQLHVRSAVCPHLQCIVDWNTTEKTWDCPCHGSRFTATGRVINGPANTDLAMIDPTPDERQRAQQQHDGENATGRETERPIKQAGGRADASNGDETFPESEPPGTKIQGDKYGVATPDVRGEKKG